MNKTRIKAALLLTLLLAAGTLCGCSLADETMQADSADDHACGVYVIRRSQQEALDKKRYNEQGDFIKNYAQMKNTGDGTLFNFEGVDGEYLLVQQADGAASVTKSEAMADSGLRVEGNEQTGAENLEEQKNVVCGTVHFVRGSESEFLCCFIRKDKKGYYLGEQATAGIDAVLGGSLGGEASWTVTENNSRITKTFAYEVNFEEEDPVLSVAAKEMNGRDQVVKTTEIQFKDDGYHLKLKPQTQYVIVEETAKDQKGKEIKKRSIYDWSKSEDGEELTHYSYVSHKSGILKPQELIFTK